jgi:hypothetical protein
MRKTDNAFIIIINYLSNLTSTLVSCDVSIILKIYFLYFSPPQPIMSDAQTRFSDALLAPHSTPASDEDPAHRATMGSPVLDTDPARHAMAGSERPKKKRRIESPSSKAKHNERSKKSMYENALVCPLVILMLFLGSSSWKMSNRRRRIFNRTYR